MRGDELPSLQERIERELAFWRTSPEERPGAFSPQLLVHKLSEGRILLEGLERHRSLFDRAATIVELGAGQGWASCLLKAVVDGGKTIYATDVSADAVASVPEWERVFTVSLAGAFACPSFELPFDAGSVDLAFAFQAAHHFGAHRRTLTECRRVLRPGGAVLYLNEPTTPGWLYSRALARVNRKRVRYHRDELPPGREIVEDVIVGSRLVEIAREVGFSTERVFTPTLTNRGPVELAYYFALSRAGFAQSLLPCTADFVFGLPG